MRPQLPVAQLAGEGRIGTRVAESHDLGEQDRGPHVLVVNQPLTHVGLDLVERVRHGPLTHTDLSFSVQVATDRLAVPANVTGDGRDRPPPLLQRVDLQVFVS